MRACEMFRWAISATPGLWAEAYRKCAFTTDPATASISYAKAGRSSLPAARQQEQPETDIENAGGGDGLETGMTEAFARWDATEHLRTEEDVRLYLEACAEEDPGDGSLIRAALNDIARAQNMSRLARDAGMTREGLYKALSENGNPTFTTVTRIARALGMRVRITV